MDLMTVLEITAAILLAKLVLSAAARLGGRGGAAPAARLPATESSGAAGAGW